MQAAAGVLLQRRGHKRRERLAGIRLLLDGSDGHLRALQPAGKLFGLLLAHYDDVAAVPRGLQLAVVAEVTSDGHALAVQAGQAGLKGARVLGARVGVSGIELGEQIPVLGALKRHALPLALDDDAGGHRLHAAGGQPRHDLLPQHRGHLVAVEAVEDAAGLLGIDKIGVELAGVFRRLEDGGLGDLVKDHAAHRHLRLEHLQQVPRDGLAFAVGVCGEVELIALLQLLF